MAFGRAKAGPYHKGTTADPYYKGATRAYYEAYNNLNGSAEGGPY
ncbi:hypothetical protein KSD_94280 [Ktedonobacter sp. SOSP1-85]|nr:hypothetical protein KSD_94280 [Ktedonobacter sp. SOSP1-85]